MALLKHKQNKIFVLKHINFSFLNISKLLNYKLFLLLLYKKTIIVFTTPNNFTIGNTAQRFNNLPIIHIFTS